MGIMPGPLIHGQHIKQNSCDNTNSPCVKNYAKCIGFLFCGEFLQPDILGFNLIHDLLIMQAPFWVSLFPKIDASQ